MPRRASSPRPSPHPALAHRNLPLLLAATREEVLQHFRPILNRFGVTEQQWRIMRVLHERGPLEPWQIASACQILSPSLTGILTRMEAVELVERERSAADQRRQTVTLGVQGKARLRAMAPLVNAQYRAIEAAVGADAVAALYATLDAMLERLRAAPVASVADALPLSRVA